MRMATCIVWLAVVAFAAPAAAQSLYDMGRSAWDQGDYRVAHDALLEFRKAPYGRRPDVDFMLGTSGCRLDERRTWGGNVLDWMLYAYALTADSRQVVSAERDLCRDTLLATRVGTDVGSIVEERAAGMTGFGKTFFWSGRDEQPVASFPIRRTDDIPRSAFEGRLTPLDAPDAALALARRLSPRGQAAIHGSVLLISEAGHTPAQLASVGRTLNRFIGFLETTYGIARPDYFVTVWLMPGNYDVREAAARLHGLEVSPATVGYAFVDDASVVGAVSGTAVGTILHELFHLLARNRFGDIPQWLDEGMAALYEVSGRRGDRYFGLANWRGAVLRELWSLRPSVEDLIRAEWFLFDDPAQAATVEDGMRHPESFFEREEAARQAASMATARYFALFLQEQGQLAAVFEAVRDGGALDDPTLAAREIDARARAVGLVEATLGRPLADVDAEFVAWLRADGPRRIGQGASPVAIGAPLYRATADVRIRSGPSTGHERLGLVREGDRIAVFAEKLGWAEVRLSDGAIGFVSMRYLEPL